MQVLFSANMASSSSSAVVSQCGIGQLPKEMKELIALFLGKRWESSALCPWLVDEGVQHPLEYYDLWSYVTNDSCPVCWLWMDHWEEDPVSHQNYFRLTGVS